MILKFKSWVPSVLARLSFSEIGNTSEPTRCVRANEGDSAVRYIIAYQKRVTLDAILPFKAISARKIAQLEGQMWFVCIGKTEDYDGRKMEKLSGRLFLFHNHDRWKDGPEQTVRDSQSNLRNLGDDVTNLPLQSFENEFQDLLSDLLQYASFYTEFSLFRTGETELTFDSSISLHSNAPYLGSPPNAHLVHIVASQIFFFLKDICHNHQHHRPRTDTIIDLHPFISERHWREQVQYSLYRKIIQFKRNPTIVTVADSQGVLAYTKAFSKLSQAYLAKESVKEKLPYFDNESLSESLDSAANHVSWNMQKRSRKSDQFLSWFVGILGTIFALTSLLSLGPTLETEMDPHLRKFGSFMIGNPFSIILVIFILVAAKVEFEHKDNFRRAVRLVQPFKRDYVALFFILMSFIGFYYVLSSDIAIALFRQFFP